MPRSPRSRRCVTQRDFPKYSPSEYARLHSPSSPAGAAHMFTSNTKIPVHKPPVAIAEEMSRLDPYYIPSPAQGWLSIVDLIVMVTLFDRTKLDIFQLFK